MKWLKENSSPKAELLSRVRSFLCCNGRLEPVTGGLPQKKRHRVCGENVRGWQAPIDLAHKQPGQTALRFLGIHHGQTWLFTAGIFEPALTCSKCNILNQKHLRTMSREISQMVSPDMVVSKTEGLRSRELYHNYDAPPGYPHRHLNRWVSQPAQLCNTSETSSIDSCYQGTDSHTHLIGSRLCSVSRFQQEWTTKVPFGISVCTIQDTFFLGWCF
jgi:hypothetical protein